ncbi:uncharacterized protein ACA1_128020 [Acanthamoeba castellanii str. Neff]|uniref:Glycoside hydrolase family 125 protein n=1 Tax=Acanthamoeba castellanii (strain ATCC 30010 / Neff) TaxID=1257118 RepID=L8GWI3_ACACF|nr:uncharacterized protein ACA1_128020 [Acanthamoeba castellanii str. Neff]ELR16948.1 hypothetical protein ACA1_128020 [Acanthamoeba castellanii str. Neff]
MAMVEHPVGGCSVLEATSSSRLGGLFLAQREAERLKPLLHADLLQRQEQRLRSLKTQGDGGDGGARADLVPAAVEREVERVAHALESVGRTKLAAIFRACFVSTLETTTLLMPNGHTHVFTGDIPAMWLRDSAAQVNHYIPLAAHDLHLQVLIEGLIKRQANRILLDPYANAFRDQPFHGLKANDRRVGKTEEIWERKYEVDSLCYFLSLSFKYWNATGSTTMFDDEWLRKKPAGLHLDLEKPEAGAEPRPRPQTSPYKYHTEMPQQGIGADTAYTGMTWSGFRPSDDACKYPFLVPSNMFAVVTLGYLAEIAERVYANGALSAEALALRQQIDDGIHKHAIVNHPTHGKIYAYETDGRGLYNLMDDANVPSLLSMPYLGYRSPHDPDGALADNTRRFVLSKDNPYFYTGCALTSTDPREILELIATCENTDADKGVMHESFNPNRPAQFTRPWFAWANSLFAELLADVVLRWYWGPPLRDLYARFDPFPSTANRTGLILAVAAVAEREGFRFHLAVHYQGGINYEAQRQLFERCRITINTHVNFGGPYRARRDRAGVGLLLATQSIMEHGREYRLRSKDHLTLKR